MFMQLSRPDADLAAFDSDLLKEPADRASSRHGNHGRGADSPALRSERDFRLLMTANEERPLSQPFI